MTQALSTNEVPKMLQDIEEKLKAIKTIEGTRYKTHGQFKYSPSINASSVDITRCTNMSTILSITGFLISKEEHYDKAAQLLGVKSYPVAEWCGAPISAWKEDLKLRAAIISSEDNRKMLIEAKKELSQFLTEEERRNTVVERYKALFGN